jgi:hypothetical protein
MSQRERFRDFNAPRATTPIQTRIDTGPWTSKGKSAKEAIEQAWSKWFHVSGIPGRNTDNPYFISAVKQTQQSLCISIILFYNMFSCNCVVFQVRGSLLHRKETLMVSN